MQLYESSHQAIHNYKMKNKIMLAHLISLVHLLILGSCNQKAETETYLIPEGFTGKVNIIFNRKEGNLVSMRTNEEYMKYPVMVFF